MDWIQFFTLLATMLAGFGFIYKEVREDIKTQAQRVDEQAKRTDRLYEIVIDLLKEKK